MKSHRLDSQRGTAALEFAICVPILLMLMGGTLYFGLALLARLQLTQLASETARTCVLQQYGSSGVQAYISCAQATFPNLMQMYGMHPCDNNASPSLSVDGSTSLDASIPAQAASQINLLRVSATCNKTISPIVNGTRSGTGLVPLSLRIYGQAGMPYVLAMQPR